MAHQEFDVGLRIVDGGMQVLAGILPSSVKVHTQYRGPIVPIDDTVRVEHGYDLKDKFLTQLIGFWSV